MTATRSAIAALAGDPPGSVEDRLGYWLAALDGLVAERDDVALVVLPKHCFTGWPLVPADRVDLAMDAALSRLASACGRLSIWCAGATLTDDDRRGWRAAGGVRTDIGFLCGPDGTLVQRRVATVPDLSLRSRSSVASIDAGESNLVSHQSGVGCLGVVVGDEIRFAEVARSLVLSGAEILLNPAVDRSDPLDAARRRSRRARANENRCFVVVASDQRAAIIGPDAELIAAREGPGAVVASLDLEALRRRRSGQFTNYPAQIRTALYRPEYPAEEPQARGLAGREAVRGAGWTGEGRIAEVETLGIVPATEVAPLPYGVLLVQTELRYVTDRDRRDEQIMDNLERGLAVAAPLTGPTTKLVVFPEYWLQGTVFTRTPAEWEHFAIRIPGPETERLGRFAREKGLYLAGAAFEFDPDWPGRWFNTAFLLGPDGEVVLRYRKLQCGDSSGMLSVTTPGQILTPYTARYGREALFPVADTPIGRIGLMICYDGNFPELYRALAVRGAEVICYPTGDTAGGPVGWWENGITARAGEAQVYQVSVNCGAEVREPGGAVTNFHKGRSRLIDFDGNTVAQADGAGVVPLQGTIDIGALRRARRDPWRNQLAWHRPQLFHETYAIDGLAADCFLETPPWSAEDQARVVREAVARFQRLGIYTAPR